MLVGKANDNPILDTRTRTVQLPDGIEEERAESAIDQNVLSQCNVDRNQTFLIEATTDHKSSADDAKKTEQSYLMKQPYKNLYRVEESNRISCCSHSTISTVWPL